MQLYRPDINVEVLARFRLASVFLLFSPDIFPPGRHDLSTVMEEVTIHFLYGITTPKGQKLILKYQQQRQKGQI